MAYDEDIIPIQPLIRSIARGAWVGALTVGLLSVGCGILLMFWPGPTLVAIAVLLGIQMLISGIYRIFLSFDRAEHHRILAAVSGVIVLVGGIIVLRRPFTGIGALTLFIGIAWLVSGIIDLADAVNGENTDNRGWEAVLAVLSIAAGIAVLVWPTPSIGVIAWVSALYLIILGAMFMVAAFRVRRTAE
ncbi:MAG: HdeD family acid-resistance protein [Acidimicrobiia bacterium]|nr:HdeD family acid-resistance protein [Acidimicrobiia bacterium]MBP8179729.1 HdeD family acid-resistance protein [Acidimicrobiia bacterium]